jgi:hypothetical protein
MNLKITVKIDSSIVFYWTAGLMFQWQDCEGGALCCTKKNGGKMLPL